MKKALKILYIVIINIIFLAVLFFAFDYSVYRQACKEFHEQHPNDKSELKYSYKTVISDYLYDLEHFFNGKGMYLGRLPDGLEYKDKPAIVVFGCSYAFGQYLNPNQTFSYKLAHQLKRPVYNRGAVGWSTQHMYYQTLSDAFYNDIPKNTDTVIYVMIGDHLRRSQIEHFFITDKWAYLHYTLKNDEFIQDNYNSKLANFFRALYIRKRYNHVLAQKYQTNDMKYVRKAHKIVAKFIIKSKHNMEDRLGKKLNFYVLYYEPGDWKVSFRGELSVLLMKEGIKTISTTDLTDEDLFSKEYMMHENWHPQEKAWNLLTPLIIEKLQLKD